MALIKDLYILIVVLFTMQSTLSKSVNVSLKPEEKTEKYLLAEKELLEFTFKNLNDIYLHYGEKVQNISENILKSFPLKKNLIDKETLLEEYAINNNNSFTEFGDIWFVLESIISNDEYLKWYNDELKVKNETEIITRDFDIRVLTKIRSEHLDIECKKSVHDFLEKLKQKLEGTKIYLEKDQALVVWFEEFKTFTKFDDKMDALYEFVHGLCRNLNIKCHEEFPEANFTKSN